MQEGCNPGEKGKEVGEKRVGRGSPIVALREVEKNFATFRYTLRQKWHKEAENHYGKGWEKGSERYRKCTPVPPPPIYSIKSSSKIKQKLPPSKALPAFLA